MSAGRSHGGVAERVVPHTRIEDDSKIEETYKLGRKLGQGNFGVVREGTNIQSGVTWAIKAVNKEKAGSSAIKLLEREVAILKRVQHKHIIHLQAVYETSKRMYLVMELCDMELANLLKQKGTCNESESKTIVDRLASAISYLHKNDIVHRDLKLENILLSHDPENPGDKLQIKVTDFGLSVVSGGVGHDNMLQEFCGTPMYMSPEIIDNKMYSQQCDVWAMGVITYNLLCGQPPFKAKDEETLYVLIKKGEVKFPESICKEISDEARNCICGMLKTDPAHRLTANEVLDHPWITGKDAKSHPSNVLEMMRQWKDELRLEAEDDQLSSAINGDKETTNMTATAEGTLSASKSVENSASNNNNKKIPPAEQRSQSGTDSPGSKRISVKTSNKQTSSRPGKSKSPLIEKSHHVTDSPSPSRPTGNTLQTPGQSNKKQTHQTHHAAKTAATPTSRGTVSSNKKK